MFSIFLHPNENCSAGTRTPHELHERLATNTITVTNNTVIQSQYTIKNVWFKKIKNKLDTCKSESYTNESNEAINLFLIKNVIIIIIIMFLLYWLADYFSYYG